MLPPDIRPRGAASRRRAHEEGESPGANAFMGRNPIRAAQRPQLSRLQSRGLRWKGRPIVDLSAFKPAHRIIKNGKEIRDAVTHPSAQYDPDDRAQKKMTLLAGLKLPEMESLYKDICEYVKFIEKAIGCDPKESVPWLFDEFGFRDAKAETL